MARRRRSRARNTRRLLAFVLVVVAVWYAARSWWPGGDAQRSDRAAKDTAHRPLLAAPAADTPLGATARRSPGAAAGPAEPAQPPDLPARYDALLARARELLADDHPVEARAMLMELLGLDPPPAVREPAIDALTRIAARLTFSPAVLPSDPYAGTHVVQPGEYLSRIAPRYHITADLIARINNLPDRNTIRAGQRLKVLHGPFHLQVFKKRFEMLVFLQDVLVARYPVGLGADDGTPTGTWVVKNKLRNPTYYPPRGGRIIPADDPENPLGEHWIGMEGIEGEAVGQVGYGIHGTIEPDSIGRNVSLGCIRMHNEDVEWVFAMVVPGESTVTVFP